MLASDLGLIYANLLSDDITYKAFGMRMAPKVGYFIAQETQIGFHVEYEFLSSNYDSFKSVFGLSFYFRQYISTLNIIKVSKTSKRDKVFQLLPFFELAFNKVNAYTTKDGLFIKKDRLFIDELELKIGTSLRLWKNVYFTVHPGIGYNINFKKINLYHSGGFEYYFYKKNKKS